MQNSPTPPADAADLGEPPPLAGDVLFNQFDLSDHLLEGLEAAGYHHPTPVQVATIPAVLEGQEVVVQARTGTGKTAAFGLPLLELLTGAPRVQALVLTPTRELARQVANELDRLGQFGAVKTAAVVGGDSMTRQVTELRRGAQVVVGTPGRVLDHLRRGTLDVSRARYLVLDEADEMLSMGFAKELNAILRFVPSKRKALFFSATFPPEVERFIGRLAQDPFRVRLSDDAILAEKVEHHYYLVASREKDHHLVAVLDEERVESALVFCNRRDETRMVAKMLRQHGINATAINSDMPQSERDATMGAMRSGELTVLVATDIAARGIDLTDLSHVVNYAVPESPEQYVHRTGRTGRIGRAGTAVTLVSGRELSALRQVEKIKGIVLEERRLPAENVVMERRVERLLEDLKRVAHVRSPEQHARGERPEFRAVAKKLVDDPEASDVIYILLQSFFEGVKPAVGRALEGTEAESLARSTEAPPSSRRSPSARSAPARRRRPPR